MSLQCMHHVDRNLDAHTIWKNIEDTYNRNNVTSNLYSLNALLSLAMDNSTSICDHLQEFESRFLCAQQSINESIVSPKPCEKELTLLLNDLKAKAHLLLHTLPDTYAHIVDNLQSKIALIYSDV